MYVCMYVCIHTWNNGLRMHACVSSRHIRISDCAGLRQRADRGMIKLIGGTAAFKLRQEDGVEWSEKTEYAKSVEKAR